MLICVYRLFVHKEPLSHIVHTGTFLSANLRLTQMLLSPPISAHFLQSEDTHNIKQT